MPTRAAIVPAAPEWFHEIKFDGYRLRLERDGALVRLITKGGHDWSKRYPWIVQAALKNRRGRPDGIFVNPFEVGAIGPVLFRAACDMGLEGLVSKRSDRPYRGGRSKDWIKVKNRSHPAMEREF